MAQKKGIYVLKETIRDEEEFCAVGAKNAMRNLEARKADQLFDDYVTAYFSGASPSPDDYFAQCPILERERLREAVAGFLYAYDNYYTMQVSEDAVNSALERIRRVRQRRQALAEAEARARGVSWEKAVTEPLLKLKNVLYPVAEGMSAQRVAFLNRSTSVPAIPDGTARLDIYEKRASEHFAQGEAERLLLRVGIEKHPVSLQTIAAQLCVLVQETPLQGLEGCLVTDGDTGGILLNALTTDWRRKRFTLAHEIAHFVLHRALPATVQ